MESNEVLDFDVFENFVVILTKDKITLFEIKNQNLANIQKSNILANPQIDPLS